MSTAAAPPGLEAPAGTAQAAELARALDVILASLLAMLWGRALYARLLGPLLYPVWNRISRTRERLARALAHLAASRAPRPHRPRATPRTRRGTTAQALPIPRRRHGWLGHLLDFEVRCTASQLSHALAQPGAAELIAASPGALRTIRPLARMLGAELPAALRLPPPPPRPPAPRPARPPPAPQPPGPGLAPGDKPFPPYVLRLVRYQKRHGLWRPWKDE